MARRPYRRRHGFTPFKAADRPPPGTYDPALDQGLAAATRGYGDLQQDYDVGKARGEDDYNTGLSDLLRGHTRAGEDFDTQGRELDTGYNRSLSDLLSARTRGTEDYGQNIQTLERNYQRLGGQQGQAAAARGVTSGGALLQALAKRTENQSIERKPIDTGYNRFMDDSRAGESRLGEDYQSGRSALDRARLREGEDYARQGEGLSQSLERAFGAGGDQTIGLARGGRELTQYGIDTNQSRFAQAAQTGYVPPSRPRNEHTDPTTGQTYRLIRTPSGRLVRLLPSGQIRRRPRR